MNIRERLETFWSGERPDQIPYTIYHNEWRHTQNDPDWNELLENGLGITYHMSTFSSHTKNVEVLNDSYEQNGITYNRQTLRTPVGEIYQTWTKGWRQKYQLETPEDYAVMTYIVRNREFSANYDAFVERENEIAPNAILLAAIGRTPLQTILVDYAGIENLSMHLFDFEEEVHNLYDALLDNFYRKIEITAEGPGKFVSNLENFTADTLGPKRYEKYLLPVYEECFPILQSSGKIVGSHYDGRTASCKELIAVAPIDLIESLTEPNEGDLPLDEARAIWPDKLFWCNIRVGDYELTPDKLRKKVLDLVEQASPDGRKLAFEVSEQYPANWKESMPVVLEALKETRI